MKHKDYIFDHYSKKAQKMGYRSRAALKLIDINNKFKIFKPGQNVLDLGAAPGGWCQVAKQLTKELNQDNKSLKGKFYNVIGVDILDIKHINKVILIKEDINNLNVEMFSRLYDSGLSISERSDSKLSDSDSTHSESRFSNAKLSSSLSAESAHSKSNLSNAELHKPFDVILSDMCANKSGHKIIDDCNMLNLGNMALNTCSKLLKNDGFFVCKFFESGTINEFKENLKAVFRKVTMFKPDSSRDVSSETYFVCIK